jgi:hypothetical protein
MRLKSLSCNSFVFPVIIFALWQTGSCRNHDSGTMVKQEQHRVTRGNWGGQNIQLTVNDAGAQVQFSCSHGTIDEALVLKDGKFSARGTFIREGPGPLREDDPPAKQPAVYRGSVQDKTMTLTVTLDKTNEQVGSFELEFDTPGRVRRCH